MSLPNLKLDWLSYDAAKYAVTHWHYSRRMPKSKLVKIGAWEDDRFIGAVIFGVGATNALVKQFGLKTFEGCELVRIAFRSHETPVSKALSIAIKMLKKQSPRLRLIVSFADPKEGHIGAVYQASNWIYTGQTDWLKYRQLNGRIIHERTISDWVRSGRLKDRNQIKSIMMPPKYRYIYPLDTEIRANMQKFSKPYPKRADSSKAEQLAHQLVDGGSNPTSALHSNIGQN